MSSYLRVLRHRNFRYLFLSQTASVVGDRLVVVALALFITERTRSPTDLSLVLGAASVPLVTLVLFGGVWADRLSRQRIMLVTDVLRAALHGLLAALILTGEVRLWELIVIEALFGAAEAFFQPAYTGLLPQTVPLEQIQDARALTGATFNVAFLLGPALATALVLTAGAGVAFACDAATFVVSAALLLNVRVPLVNATAQGRGSVLVELREGWQEVRSRSWLWVTVAVFAGALLCVFAQWYALAPSVTRGVYGHATVFGLFEGLAGAGAVVGSIAALRWRPAHPLRVGILLVLTWPTQNALLALGAPIPTVGAAALMTGFGFSLFGVWWETALARHIPPQLLSRVSAWDWMGSLALLPVGYFIAAPLAGAFGARSVLGVGGAIGVALLLVALAPRATRTLSIAPRERRRDSELARAHA